MVAFSPYERRIKSVPLLYALFMVVGYTGMAPIMSLWAEVESFEAFLPSKSGSGGLIGVCYNLGNIIPFIYVCIPVKKQPTPFRMTWVLYLLGILGNLFTMFWWGLVWRGQSVGLMISAALAGIVCCGCMVTLFPFTKQYGNLYVSAVFVGMSLSGILLAQLGLYQQAGPHPIFSVSRYYQINMIGTVLGFLALSVIRVYAVSDPGAKKEKGEGAPLMADVEHGKVPLSASLTPRKFAAAIASPLANIFVISVAFYFLLPGLLPFSARAFENHAQINNRAMFFFNVANFLGRLIPSFWRPDFLTVPTIVGAAIFGWCLYLGVRQGHGAPAFMGGQGMLLAYAAGAFGLLQGFVAVMTYIVVDLPDRLPARAQREKATQLAGISNQVGSLVGSWVCEGFIMLGWLKKN